MRVILDTKKMGEEDMVREEMEREGRGREGERRKGGMITIGQLSHV